jgi:hypothetical protein
MEKQNKNEWGNIELPGLTDEELFETNWNYVDANRQKAKDKTVMAKISGSLKEYYKDNKDAKIEKANCLKKTNKILMADPEYRKKLKQQRQQQANDPNYKNKLMEGVKRRESDPEYKKIRKNMIEKRSKNTQWKESIKKAQQNRSEEHKKNLYRTKAYPIVTPYGIFNGLIEAHDKINLIKNFNNGRKWILGMMKKDPTNFYRITWEEYDNLIKTT